MRVLSVLRGLSEFTGGVYDGLVPANVPTDTTGKWVKPYVCLYAGIPGDLPTQRDLTHQYDLDTSDWRPGVTVVGASAASCRDGATTVLRALANHPIGNGYLKPDAVLHAQLQPIPDTTVTPTRYYLPLQFRLITTT